jgi:anaerobic ribonucleoside-triphosphate reductase activating protein
MYTGFTYDEDLIPGGRRYTEVTDEILDSIDVLVDGKFVEELKNIRLNYRGSENQRIISMKETRTAGHVVLSELNN